jgi:hypothetical protein
MEKNNVRAFKSRFKYSIRAYFRDCLFRFLRDACAHTAAPLEFHSRWGNGTVRRGKTAQSAGCVSVSALCAICCDLFVGFHRLIPIIYLSPVLPEHAREGFVVRHDSMDLCLRERLSPALRAEESRLPA